MLSSAVVLFLILGGPPPASAPTTTQPATAPADPLAPWRKYLGKPEGKIPDLYPLLEARFAATDMICAALDREPGSTAAWRKELYRALSVVKDPRTIEWLEARLDGPDAKLIESSWLMWWESAYLWSPTRWRIWPTRLFVERREAWTRFFLDWADSLPEEHRGPFVRILAYLSDDEATVNLFLALERRPDLPWQDRLLAETYLVQHDRPIDGAQAALAVQRLLVRDSETALAYAEALRQEALVPWLVRLLYDKREEEQPRVENALRCITLARDVHGWSQWFTWYVRHEQQSRAQWISEAMDSFRELLERDPVEAKRALAEQVNLHRRWPWNGAPVVAPWGDAVLLPYMKEFAAHSSLHPEIAQWVRASYHPCRRAEYQPLVDQLLRESREQLDTGVIESLGLYGLTDRPPTWQEHIQRWFLGYQR